MALHAKAKAEADYRFYALYDKISREDILGGGLASAQQSGTAAEARAMLDRAVVALKADKATALSAFNDKSNKQFHHRDLYVFCQDISDGKFTAHPNPALMGTDGRALKVQGRRDRTKSLRRASAHAGRKRRHSGNNFPKPGTTEPVPEEFYVTRVGDQGCGVGYYK